MKWGVRKNRQRAGEKVSKQVTANRSKADALRTKAYKNDKTSLGKSKTAKQAKYLAKAAKYQRKADRSQWDIRQDPVRRATNQRKALKYQQKAQGLSGSVGKVAKLNAKASKLEYKADRLEKAYEKQISKLDQKDVKKGRSLVESVTGR